ncbi:MAG: hypothetical protein ABIQ17_00660 [Candidatus Limnocylindrales bacterium]
MSPALQGRSVVSQSVVATDAATVMEDPVGAQVAGWSDPSSA